MLNDPGDWILVCKYGKHYRWTINPPSRKHGSKTWDAGYASDWCEVASLSQLEAARNDVKAKDEVLAMWGRIDRQKAAHDTTHCIREGNHWPRDRANA